jgi:hypothetical protein
MDIAPKNKIQHSTMGPGKRLDLWLRCCPL